MRWRKLLFVGAGILGGAGVITYLLVPQPTSVDAGAVTAGPLEVTIDEQGETRCHDRFLIAAPVSGRLMRIELHPGDDVQPGQILAQIAALPLSVREREEQRARVAAAEALRREANEHVRRLENDLTLARAERARIDKLVRDGALAARDSERAQNLETTTANELDGARFRVASASAQVEVARSGLPAEGPSGTSPNEELVQIRAPMAGRVLRIEDASERVVSAGSPVMTLGSLDKLEVAIELLTTDAVRVEPGMPVRLESWGGKAPLRARIRLVEPFAFTKTSALGVDEKRTNVIADLLDRPPVLGDGYRVTAQIVVWSSERSVKLPVSALFGCGQTFCAFAIEGGRAVRRELVLGQRNALEAEVLRGLRVGEQVVRHPGNELEDGDRVRVR